MCFICVCVFGCLGFESFVGCSWFGYFGLLAKWGFAEVFASGFLETLVFFQFVCVLLQAGLPALLTVLR